MNDLVKRLRTTKPTTAAGHVMRLAADRIEQLEAELAALKSQVETVRDAILSGRGSLESVLDSDQTNAVLNEFDVLFAAPPLREGGMR